MHKIGIAGHTGMVGQEIQKVLSGHDSVEIVYKKNSTYEEGRLNDCELVFLATKDLESMSFSDTAIKNGVKIIDMSGAYRLPRDLFEKWYGIRHLFPEYIKKAVYGMPALNLGQIKNSRLTANPGCYPTSVILALKPLKGLIKEENISIVSTSGNSGGRRECEEISNEVTYSCGRKHKHVPEMELYSGFKVDFTPIVLRSVFKGINTNIRAELTDDLKNIPEEEAKTILENAIKNAYCKDDRIFIVEDREDKTYGTKDVNDTHDMLIKIGIDEGKVYINSLIDNLMKGAASLGAENMNIMLGLDRLHGIEIKERRTGI